MNRETCKQINGVWKEGKCTSRYGALTESIGEKVEERQNTFRQAKFMSEKFKGYGHKVTSTWSKKPILPKWVITFIALTIFTIILYLPFLGVISALVGAVLVSTILMVWAKEDGPGDAELNLVVYGIFVFVWIGTGLVSFASVGWLKIIFTGLTVDVLMALPFALQKFTKIPYVNYVTAAIAFTVTYLSIGGLEGIIVSSIAGLLALLVPIPSFVPFPPYLIPITTTVLLLVKLIANYVSEIIGAIF